MKLADFMKEPGKHAPSKRSGARDRAPMASEVAALSTAGKYTVNGTKKCAIPISVEKRKGHDLTVLSNVSGDIACLAKELKKLLGSNCVVRDFSVIEIQGHHRDRVEKFLIQKKCLKGVQKKTKELITEKFERENNMKKKKKEIKKKKDSRDVVAKLKKKNNRSASSGTTEVDIRRLTKSEISKMKPKILKQLLKQHMLSTQGNKKELIERMHAYAIKPPVAVEENEEQSESVQ